MIVNLYTQLPQLKTVTLRLRLCVQIPPPSIYIKAKNSLNRSTSQFVVPKKKNYCIYIIMHANYQNRTESTYIYIYNFDSISNHNPQHVIRKYGGAHLELRRIDREGLVAFVFGESRVFAGGESGDDLDGGLDAAYKRRDEDPIDLESEIGSELRTRAEGPILALLDQRRVPWSRCLRHPERLEVVDAIAVAHDDDVLEALRRGLAGVGPVHIGRF